MKKFLICLLCILMFSCSFFEDLFNLDDDDATETVTDDRQVSVTGESFTISWDTNTIYNDTVYEDSVSQYRIYYRTHDTSTWIFLDEIESNSTLEYTITDTDLDYGNYDFGVSSVNDQGTESDIHSSLDDTADPDSGWYISWSSAS